MLSILCVLVVVVFVVVTTGLTFKLNFDAKCSANAPLSFSKQ